MPPSSNRLSMSFHVPYSPHPPVPGVQSPPAVTPPNKAVHRQSTYGLHPASASSSSLSGGTAPSPPFLLEMNDEELAGLGNAYDWFESTVCWSPASKFNGIRREHRLDPAQIPYWLGAGHDSLNWDALLLADRMQTLQGSANAAFPPGSKSPRRVLDLGTGVCPHWCLMMLRVPEWSDVQFVGLDVAPVLLPPSLLPSEASSRISFIQHNFLTDLPFDDACFDFVRISGAALSCPEHTWEHVLEEAVRVLLPGSPIEIVDTDFTLVIPISHANDPSTSIVRDAYQAAFARRWLSLAPLSCVPPALATNCTAVKTTHREIPFPTQLPPAQKEPQHEVNARVLLSAWAQRLDGASPRLAEDLVLSRKRVEPGTSSPLSIQHHSQSPPHSPEAFRTERSRSIGEGSSTPGSGKKSLVGDSHDGAPLSKTRKEQRDEREVAEAVGEYTYDLHERAGIDRLVEERLGWVCEMDRQLEEALESFLPKVEERIRLYEQEEREETLDPRLAEELSRRELDASSKKAQTKLIQREWEAGLKAVQKRLGKRAVEPWTWTGAGSLKVQDWVARAPS